MPLSLPFMHPAAKKVHNSLEAFWQNEKNTALNRLREIGTINSKMRLITMQHPIMVMLGQFIVWLLLTFFCDKFLEYAYPSPGSIVAILIQLFMLELFSIIWVISNLPNGESPKESRWFTVTATGTNHFAETKEFESILKSGIRYYRNISHYFSIVSCTIWGGVISTFFSSSSLRIPFWDCTVSPERFIIFFISAFYIIWILYLFWIRAPLNWLEKVLEQINA